MTLLTTTETLPLATDTHGVIRVSKPRVTLDTIVMSYLAYAYYIIGYYQRRKNEVEADLNQRRQQAAEIRKPNEPRFKPASIRSHLVARRASARHADMVLGQVLPHDFFGLSRKPNS